MKRKFLSLALVIAMLASMLVVVPTAGATEIANVEVTNAVGFAGDTVTVDVVVTTETMSGYQFLFEYDRTKLELVKTNGVNGTMPAGNGFAGVVDSADDSYALMNWAGTVKNAAGEAVLDADGNPIPAAFSSIFWNDTNATQHDCLAGVRAATLTFKIKEDATPGDAYVSIGYLCGDSLDSKGENVVENYQPNKIETANGTVNAEGAISFNPGKITVLPEGYIGADEAPVNDFTYLLWDDDFNEEAWEKADADSIAITAYNGAGAETVVIPSEIEGLPVKRIQLSAFNGTANATIGAAAIQTVVIPASVTLVESAAFVNCSSLTDVYVLNAETVFNDAAVGYNASKVRLSGTTVQWQGKAVATKDDGTALTTVHAPAGSSAETMATTEYGGLSVGFDATSVYTVSFAGMTFYTTSETTVPGQMLNDGDVTVAWKNGDTVLAPGAKMTLTADTALESVTIAAPELVNGVSLKITEAYEDFAMRFTTTLSVNDYNALRALGGKITMGTIITPAAYVERAGALTKEALNTLNTANKYIDVPTTGYMTEADGVYTFAGSVRNFKKANRDVDYAAAFYLTVTLADGNTFTVYSAYNHNANRNLGDTMTKLAASGTLNGDPRLTWLEKHMASLSN